MSEEPVDGRTTRPGERGERSRMVRAAGLLGGSILGARGLGLVRDVMLAYYLGTGHVVDAWFVANRVPNLLRFHLTEGSLNAAFVPVFSEYLEKHGKREARRFAGSALSAFALVLAGVVLLGVIAAPLLVRVLAPGFKDVPGKLDLAAQLTAWNFAYLLLVALAALGMAMLQSLGHFRTSAVSQLLYNVFVILAIVTVCRVIGDTPEQWILGVMAGVIVSGIVQLAIQVPPLARRDMLPASSTFHNRSARARSRWRSSRTCLGRYRGTTSTS
jgi:putative peptidoglycan lipid II flippase